MRLVRNRVEPAVIDRRVKKAWAHFDPNVWSGRASQEGFGELVVAVLHQCIRPLIEACASGHHGNQRAWELISGQTSLGH